LWHLANLLKKTLRTPIRQLPDQLNGIKPEFEVTL
jgi:hypothetical protein